jgi:ribosomal protein S18 acetylase RimI-like enzyme
LLQQHGFEHQGEIHFLARQLTPADHSLAADETELNFETFCEANRHRFESTIERTYEESQDCPFLNGFRNGADAVISHQLPGQFDPAGWRLYGDGKEDFGVLLMNEHPENDAIELVYFGITPGFRGRGLGRRVLKHGLQGAALTGRALIFLTVDSGNIYANSLYGELGFSELARRQILIRRLA